jgi:hypothetical protein
MLDLRPSRVPRRRRVWSGAALVAIIGLLAAPSLAASAQGSARPVLFTATDDYLVPTGPGSVGASVHEYARRVLWFSPSDWSVVAYSTYWNHATPPSMTSTIRFGRELTTVSGRVLQKTEAGPLSLADAAPDALFRVPDPLTAPWSVANCGPTLRYQKSGPLIDGIRTEVIHRSAVRCAFSDSAPSWTGPSTLWFDPRSRIVLRVVLHLQGGATAEVYTATVSNPTPAFLAGMTAIPQT